MTKHIVFISILSLTVLHVESGFCQPTFQNSYGGTWSEYAYSARQTSDGGYILAGHTASFGAGSYDAYVVKTDANGNIQWSGTFGGAAWEEAHYAWQNSDGSYIVAGYSESFGTVGYRDGYLIKLDVNGNYQWSKIIGATGVNQEEQFHYVQQTTDGGYFIVGWMSPNSPGGDYDVYAVKTDASGNLQWTRRIGGSNSDMGWSGQQVSDGGYILIGETSSYGAGFSDVYLLKLDASGTLQWTATFGGASTADYGKGVKQTTDGGYIIGGNGGLGSGSYDIYLIKTTSTGTLSWAKTYGSTAQEESWNVWQTNDGGYITAGRTPSNGWDIYVVKTDGSGNLSWGKQYGSSSQEIPFFTVQQTADGGYVTNGYTNAPPTVMIDFYLLKMDANGSSNCNEINISPSVLSPAFSVGSGGGTSTWGSASNPATVVNTPSTISASVCSCVSPAANAGADVTICTGANTTLNVTSGAGTPPFTYLWTPSASLSNPSISNPVASPTATTTYTVTVTNTCGSSTDFITVNVNPIPTANISPSFTTICNGQNATLTASGGGTYLWSPGGQTTSAIMVSPTSNSTYTVTVTDGFGCTNTASSSVTVNPVPSASVSPSSATICNGQNATLTASGGGTYSWNTGATASSIIVSPTATSSYSVIVSNGNCSSAASVNVTVASLSAGVQCPTDPCFGSSMTIGTFGGNSYSWSTGASSSSITVITTSSNTYYVTISDSVTGCSVNDSCFLAPPPDAAITIVGNDTVCAGSSLTLSSTSAQAYFWSTGGSTSTITVNPTASATYSVVIVNGLCWDTAYLNVTVLPAPSASVSGSTAVCIGDTVTLTASGGNIYSWNTGATTTSISVSPTGTSSYTVIATDTNGCTDDTAVTVTVNPLPNIIITGNTTICSGSSTTLSASGGTTYSWSTGATTSSITASASSSYTVTGTDANGCSSAATATVSVIAPPVATISGTDTICAGEIATLTASGGGTYSWNTGATTSSISSSLTSTSTFSVIVSVGTCSDTAFFTVNVQSNPTANAGADVTIILGNNTTLIASGGGTYSWSTGETTNPIVVNPTSTTTYTVLVTDTNGCTDVAQVTVYVGLNCGEFFIPNAFSPNGDGKNDVFRVRSSCLKTLHLVVYDRWGNKVFETEDITEEWDGNYQPFLFTGTGKAQEGVYVYRVEATLLDGNKIRSKGNISLIR